MGAAGPREISNFRLGRAQWRVPPEKIRGHYKSGAWHWNGGGGGPGGVLTCIGRSVVAADICGFMRVGGYHLIVVLVRAVDTHLRSSTGLTGNSVPGLVSSPTHPA